MKPYIYAIFFHIFKLEIFPKTRFDLLHIIKFLFSIFFYFHIQGVSETGVLDDSDDSDDSNDSDNSEA